MADNNTERRKSFEAAFGMIEKKYGKGSIFRMSESPDLNIPTISTGSLSLDIALGVGGLPQGRVVEIFGPESSGKTTVALSVVAQAQKNNLNCAYIDAENALDPSYAKKIGVDLENLFISQPDNGEQALEIVETLVRSNGVDVVVIDSVAALTPRAEIEGNMGDSHVGLQARLMSQALRKLTGAVKQSNTLVIFINQIRMKIGVMFGNPETTTGGNALRFYASVRLDIRRTAQVKDKENVIANTTRVKVVKNKVAPPFREAIFDIVFNKGINKAGEIIDIGAAQGFIEKAGAWYSYEGQKIGQGKAKAIEWLEANPEIAQELEFKIKDKLLQNTDLLTVGGEETSEEELGTLADELF
ncbi:recombinase RecA [Psittacicella hinzii]|uniref:Protein RecA n=1 Tax=Psittacicella hinzii TaxID=2028575 RepID=A0A3A1YHG6_9GAMM|nr:recombinase RecA [Psittacicella hinzii]RIY37135.1 recombinase RecA [Psittacicella hinzii]